jgi:hypothetical protein
MIERQMIAHTQKRKRKPRKGVQVKKKGKDKMFFEGFKSQK